MFPKVHKGRERGGGGSAHLGAVKLFRFAISLSGLWLGMIKPNYRGYHS